MTKPSVDSKCTVGTDVLLYSQSETVFAVISYVMQWECIVIVYISAAINITNRKEGRRITSKI